MLCFFFFCFDWNRERIFTQSQNHPHSVQDLLIHGWKPQTGCLYSWLKEMKNEEYFKKRYVWINKIDLQTDAGTHTDHLDWFSIKTPWEQLIAVVHLAEIKKREREKICFEIYFEESWLHNCLGVILGQNVDLNPSTAAMNTHFQHEMI